MKKMDLYSGIKSTETLSKYDETRVQMSDLLYPKSRKMEVDKNWFMIGRLVYIDIMRAKRADPDTYYFLKNNEVWRAVVLGKTRSGKTSLMRRIVDIAHFTGYHCIWLNDIKNEASSSIEKQTGHLLKYLHPDDIPMAENIEVYRPAFLKKYFR